MRIRSEGVNTYCNSFSVVCNGSSSKFSLCALPWAIVTDQVRRRLCRVAVTAMLRRRLQLRLVMQSPKVLIDTEQVPKLALSNHERVYHAL